MIFTRNTQRSIPFGAWPSRPAPWLKRTVPLTLVALTVSSLSLAAAGQRSVQFHIDAQSLSQALLQFGTQAHVEISFETTPELTARRKETLRGRYTIEEGLRQLLRGSDLQFVQHGDAVAVSARSLSRGTGAARGAESAAANSTEQSTPGSAPEASGGSEPRRGSEPLQEVIVTGTHIRGAAPQSAPIITFTAAQIENSGYPTLQQFMQSIPQNFSAVGNGTDGLGENALSGNSGFGTGVDLRGLGFNSTLVLLNGHRIAPAGTSGAFTDVSVIPLSAIKRIEILPEGASAVYGSDAVGGVVNYILKTDEEGADSSLTYGAVTSGGLRDFRATQSIGGHWSNGGGLLSYEYHDESPLLAWDRSFSAHSVIQDIIPESRQHALFGELHQIVGGDVALSGDAMYVERHDHAHFKDPSLPEIIETADTKQYQVGAGVTWNAGGTWVGTGHIGYGGNSTVNVAADQPIGADSRLVTVDVGANGVLWRLPSGSVRAAVGAQGREERLHQTNTIGIPTADRGRTVEAVYAEARAPLMAPRSDAGPDGAASLELDVAGRLEHYSDFGSSVNPSVGVAWRPAHALRVRGTWDTSFTAPQLWELYGDTVSVLYNTDDPAAPGGKEAILMRAGSNPDLRAERSRQWTAGLDFFPPSMPAAAIHLTYYSIDFSDRITAPGFSPFTVLVSGSQYAPFVQQSPPFSEVSSLAAAPFYYENATLIPLPAYAPPRALTDVAAIADNRLQNIGVTKESGLDLLGSYSGNVAGLGYDLGVDATELLVFEQKSAQSSSYQSLLSTLHNPLEFRARVTAAIGRGGWRINTAFNYYNHYVDNTIQTSPIPIASWETLDLRAQYGIPFGADRLLQIALSCTNCLDRPPPFVSLASDPEARGYDPTNADPMGRFVSLTLRTHW